VVALASELGTHAGQSRLCRAPIAVALVAVLSTVVPVGAQSPSAPPPEPASYSYEGDTGPEHWAELDPAYAACADGSEQSPIDVIDPAPADLADPVIAYATGDAQVVNNGHTIQANAAQGSTVALDEIEFSLVQMHFHAPSEHRIYGLSAPVEAHFVNATPEGVLAVLGVMVVEGVVPNASWEPYLATLGLAEGEEQLATLDWNAMLPSSRQTFRYRGSLTTPPCTEGVEWLVLSEPVALGAGQIASFTAAYSGNNRPVQPLNDRSVEVDASEG
jgi:carbonic anhydrase